MRNIIHPTRLHNYSSTGEQNFLEFITSAETPNPFVFQVNMSTGDTLYIDPDAGGDIKEYIAPGGWTIAVSVPRASTGAGHRIKIWGDHHKIEILWIINQYLYNTNVSNYNWCGGLLTDLRLQNNYISTPPDVSLLSNLEYLAIFDNLLTADCDLTGLTNITNYLVGGNAITGDLPGLSGLSNLINLNYRINSLTQADVDNRLAKCNTLWPDPVGKTLYLDGVGNAAPTGGNSNQDYLDLYLGGSGANVKIN